MVQELHNNQQRGRLAGLTEDSAILIDTADIAEMMNYSYSHTYNKIVCRPDFPAPVDPEKRQRGSGKKNRRWIAGDVVKYIKSCRQQ